LSELGRLVPFITTTSEVLAFNRLFKEVQSRRAVETRTIMATWINVALSFRALKLLTGDGRALSKHADNFADYGKAKADQFEVEKFTDVAFRESIAKRSVHVLSDQPDATALHRACPPADSELPWWAVGPVARP